METIWTFDSLGLTLISPQQYPSPAWKSARVQPFLQQAVSKKEERKGGDWRRGNIKNVKTSACSSYRSWKRKETAQLPTKAQLQWVSPTVFSAVSSLGGFPSFVKICTILNLEIVSSLCPSCPAMYRAQEWWNRTSCSFYSACSFP